MANHPGSRLNARGRSPQRRCRVTGVFGSGFLTERTCQRLTEAASAAAFGRGYLEHGNHGGSAGRLRTTPVSTADLGMHSFSSRNRPVPVGCGEPLDGSPGVADLSLADPERSAALATRTSAVARSADTSFRFVLPYGQKERPDPCGPADPSISSASRPTRRGSAQHAGRPRGTTRSSSPYPTGTAWRNRHRSTSSTGGYSGSPPRRLVTQATRHPLHPLRPRPRQAMPQARPFR
jgi:hypothetical protein